MILNNTAAEIPSVYKVELVNFGKKHGYVFDSVEDIVLLDINKHLSTVDFLKQALKSLPDINYWLVFSQKKLEEENKLSISVIYEVKPSNQSIQFLNTLGFYHQWFQKLKKENFVSLFGRKVSFNF